MNIGQVCLTQKLTDVNISWTPGKNLLEFSIKASIYKYNTEKNHPFGALTMSHSFSIFNLSSVWKNQSVETYFFDLFHGV